MLLIRLCKTLQSSWLREFTPDQLINTPIRYAYHVAEKRQFSWAFRNVARGQRKEHDLALLLALDEIGEQSALCQIEFEFEEITHNFAMCYCA